MSRLSIAFRCFFSLLFKGKISEKLFEELRGRVASAETATEAGRAESRAASVRVPEAASPPSAAAKLTPSPLGGAERAVQVLALLQRDARLIDFIKEDIGEYDDAQVGAAVRDVHASCRATIDRYLVLEPVMADEEGKVVTVQAGFDPGTIKLIGNVTGTLPVRGVLRHRGWRAGAVRLPDLPANAAVAVIAPAEVEVA